MTIVTLMTLVTLFWGYPFTISQIQRHFTISVTVVTMVTVFFAYPYPYPINIVATVTIVTKTGKPF